MLFSLIIVFPLHFPLFFTCLVGIVVDYLPKYEQHCLKVYRSGEIIYKLASIRRINKDPFSSVVVFLFFLFFFFFINLRCLIFCSARSSVWSFLPASSSCFFAIFSLFLFYLLNFLVFFSSPD